MLSICVGSALATADVLAQAQAPAITTTSTSSWELPLIVALLVAVLVAVFWNRRHSHERRERRRLERRLQDLTDTLPECIVEYRVDPDGTMKGLFANPSARTMFRLPDGDHSLNLNDDAFLKHVHPDDRDRLRAVTKRSVDSLDSIDVSFQFMRTGGQYRWLRAVMAVRVMNDGALVWTGSIHDTTEQRQLESELQNMIASKDLFFAAASQELRKPIHALGLALDQIVDERRETIGSDSNLTDATVPDSAGQQLSLAHDTSKQLRELIDDLLELAKVQRDDLPLRPGDFSLEGLLKALEHELQLPFARKSLKLMMKFDPETPDALYGDHQRIHQVLVNLINNALQHTAKGGVTVSITPVNDDAQHHSTPGLQALRLRFTVIDTGSGMAPEQLDRVFEPLVSHQAVATDALARRTITARPDDPHGTGVGLAIGKRIVTRMGGTIGIESVLGSGTTAHFELPLETRSPAVLSPTPLARNRSAGKNFDRHAKQEHAVRRVKTPLRKARRVMVVDDDRLGRSLLATLLGNDGYQVTEAGGGDDALTKLRQNQFDAIITDLRMPGMDGVTLAKHVRNLYTKEVLLTATPRLIALSASLGGIDASESSNDVFDVLLQKPVALAELVAVLESNKA